MSVGWSMPAQSIRKRSFMSCSVAATAPLFQRCDLRASRTRTQNSAFFVSSKSRLRCSRGKRRYRCASKAKQRQVATFRTTSIEDELKLWRRVELLPHVSTGQAQEKANAKELKVYSLYDQIFDALAKL